MTAAKQLRNFQIQKLELELARRMESVLRSLPLEGSTRTWLASARQRQGCPLPNWVRLPGWLNETWNGKRAGAVPGYLVTDIVWGQYALFLCIRIQDDLLDRHRDDPRLLFVANRFLLESLETFQRISAFGPEFWEFYRECVRETVDGILEVYSREAAPGRFALGDLHLYARVNAIFRIGTAAVCHLHGRTQELRWLTDLLGWIAMFDQILDDLKDVGRDVEAGQFTWVSNVLMAAKAEEVIPLGERARRLCDGLVLLDREEVVFAELRHIAQRAVDSVPASAPPPVHALVAALGPHVESLEQGMHEARVQSVFGSDVEGRTQNTRESHR